jgi:3-oxoacyl-[acyl-carrier-protein] synthase-1
LRADGLSRAIQKALADAGCEIHEIDFRLSDVAGEQYYFKEAALAVTRLMRTRKPQFDIWHPAECTGETGAVAGALLVALSYEACRKGYAPGPRMLAHMSNDAGQRAALVLTFGGSARG